MYTTPAPYTHRAARHGASGAPVLRATTPGVAPLTQFIETYGHNRSQAYLLWALLRYWARHPQAPPLLSRPCWLARETNRLAGWVRETHERFAPIWPGNNTRQPWLGSPAEHFCRRLACLDADTLRRLDQAFTEHVLRTEPALEQVPIPHQAPKALFHQLIRQPTRGVFAQGVIYGLAHVFHGRMGQLVRTKQVCAADLRSGAWGDVEVFGPEGPTLIFEVTWSRLSRARMAAAAHHDHTTIFLGRDLSPGVREWVAARDRLAAWTVNEYADFLLAQLDADERRLALDLFANDFIRRIARGAHYALLRALLPPLDTANRFANRR